MINLIKNPIFTRGIILEDGSIHGISHWRRVEKLGLTIAEENGADQEVVSLFAYLHDARRESDDDDPDHGKRAVVLLAELFEEGVIKINKLQYEKLARALGAHNITDAQSDDITVQTCWDADRLDFWRSNIEPNPELMFTDFGKSEKMIKFAEILNQKPVFGI